MKKSFNQKFFEQLEKNRLKQSLLEQPPYVKDIQEVVSLIRQSPIEVMQNACNSWIRFQLENKSFSNSFFNLSHREREEKEQTFYDEI